MTRKVRFKSQAAAESRAGKILKEGLKGEATVARARRGGGAQAGLRVYACDYCGGWHLARA